MPEVRSRSAIEREARVAWFGGLADGDGRVSTASGAAKDVRISWDGRVAPAGPAEGATSPEELIAAAHAGCYAMVLSQAFERHGARPERLDVQARCIAEPRGGGLTIVAVQLEVEARVPGVDPVRFEALVAEAERNCPVSSALRGNIEIRVSARLRAV